MADGILGLGSSGSVDLNSELITKLKKVFGNKSKETQMP